MTSHQWSVHEYLFIHLVIKAVGVQVSFFQSVREQVSDNDFPVLEDLVKKIVKEKQPFERLVMKKSDLKEMFQYNQFKIRILDEKVKNI